MGCKRRAPGQVQPPGQPSNSGENQQGFDIEMGQLATPSRNDPIDIVGLVAARVATLSRARLTHGSNVSLASRVLTSRNSKLSSKRAS
jgi:hypothetical protein